MRRRWAIVALLTLVGPMLAGCGGLVRSYYDKVAVGMTPQEVKEILGTPGYEFADEWVYTQSDPRDLTIVTLRFQDGKLAAKSWRNPEKPQENHCEGPTP